MHNIPFGYSAMIINYYNLNSNQHCVIPENIHTPPSEGIWNSLGGGGGGGWFSKAEMLVNAWSLTGISREVGGLRKNPFRRGGMDNF